MRGIDRLGTRIAPYQARTRDWWAGRSRREQALLAALAAIALVALLVVLVIRPLQTARADALAAIRLSDTLDARILAAGPVSAATTPQRAGDLPTILAASAVQYGVVLGSVVPLGARARVDLAGVSYEGLMRWLADLARSSSVRVDRLTLTRAKTPGTVDARLELVR